VRWPGGHTNYLYGVEFFQYLSDLYGEDLISRLNLEYGAYMFSYGIDPLFRSIYGAPLSTLWIEWQEYLHKKYEKQKARITAQGLSAYTLLTTSGEEKYSPTWSPDGKYIYFTQSTVDDISQIRRVDVETGEEKKIAEGILYDDRFAISGSHMYYSRGAVFNNFYIYKDIFLMDLDNRKQKRISKGLRAGDIAVSSDGKSMAYTRNYLGSKSLWLDDLNGTQKEIGYCGQDDQYLTPAFSPDGKTMVAAKWLAGACCQGLYVIDMENNKEWPLIPATSMEANPTFSPDGRYVFFDWDRTGVVNIYAYDLQKKKLYQVSNVLGIAQMPVVSPDGTRIAFSNYSSRGYDIAVMDLDPSAWRPVKLPPYKSVRLKYPFSEEELAIKEKEVIKEDHKYYPLRYLLPKFWMPYAFYNENGMSTLLYTAGMDPVGQHMYSAQVGYDWTGMRPTYSVFYANNVFLPQIALTATDLAVPYSWEGGTYWERQRAYGIYASLYHNGVYNWYDRQIFSAGYEGIGLSNISSIESYTNKPSIGDLKGFALAWRYMSLKRYQASISAEDGVDMSFKTVMYASELGSDFTFTRYSGGIKRYFPMMKKRHVLMASFQGVLSRGHELQQGSFSWEYLPIRGYPSNLIYGTKGGLGTLEYRFPIANPEIGMSYGYLFFEKLWGAVYFDEGGATSGSFADMLWRKSAGAEINLETANMYGLMSFMLKAGYAKGFDAGGEDQFYFLITM
ncbi:MAG: hypothetical protein ABIB65_05015, partial [Candidatus Margulisiibacteriota bacterium]